MPDAHDPHDLPTLPLSDSGDEDGFGTPDPQNTIQIGKRPPTIVDDPMPLDATAPHARVTMPGTGGLDPNPDFAARRADAPVPNTPASPHDDFNAGFTVPHVVPFEHTLVHVPGETAPQRPPAQNAPPRQSIQPTIPAPYSPQRVANTNYSPNTQPNIPPGGQNYPAPPAYGGQTQPNSPYNAPQGYRPPTIMPPNAGQPSGQGLPPRRSRRRGCLGCSPGCLIAFFGVFVTFCGGLTLITLTLTATLGAELENRLSAQIASVGDYENFQSTFFYDRNQTLLYESFNEGRRINANTADFPQDLIDATIATEDDTFRTNPGFEVEATLRAFLQYVNLAEGSSGGSTISQQLVRNVLFEPEYRAERSVQRKFEESSSPTCSIGS